MKKPLKALASIAALALLASGLSACGSASNSAGNKTETINLGVEPWLGYAPWYIAKEKGFFDKYGLKVNITSFDTDADFNAALASDKINVGCVASHTALQLQENGIDSKIVLLLDASETADAIISKTAGSIKDLKGQQVAYEEGTTSDLLLNYALDQNGMSIDDIKKVPMDADAAGAAVIAGKVPVAVTYEPYITEAQTKDTDLKTIYTGSEKEGLISDVFVAKTKFIDANADAMTKLAKAWGDSIDYYNDNTNDAQEIIAKNIGSKKADLETAFAGVKYFDLQDNEKELTGDYVKSTLPAINKAAITAQIVKGDIDATELVDATYVKEALK
ncbi:ABC transporter substrate-binding protein [Bifidobacterium moukalabense]|uniref:ABC transporter substrate-binding protein n=1 Tax=Bifidobacterium moukalabense TaxID=1333651 RepID=UPI0010F8954D|nr:ABC transporter substrate-binding protein [Bifidobacterium moukalabense]